MNIKICSTPKIMKKMLFLSFLICLLGLTGCSSQNSENTDVDIFDNARQEFESLHTVIFSGDSTDIDSQNKKRDNMLLLERIKAGISEGESSDWEYGGVKVEYSQLKNSYDIIAEKQESFINENIKKIKFVDEIYYYDSEEYIWEPLKLTVSTLNNTDVENNRNFEHQTKSIWNCDYDYIYENCKK